MNNFDNYIYAELKRQNIPGIAVGIFQNGHPVFMQGYGLSNIEHNVPVLTNTVFQTASIGKMFTAMAVMLLVEDKRIRLDESITAYLPTAPKHWQTITLRHLLTHTSGLGAIDIDIKQEFTDDEYLEYYYAAPIEFLPGERWSYSNTGYSVLGFIINKVTGKQYGVILQQRLFNPAGMHSACIINDTDIVMHRAAGYENILGEIKNQQWISASANTLAEGSLLLSLEDYLKWDNIVASRRILSKESWKQILSPVVLNNGQSYPYGFGWDIQHHNQNQLIIGHEGSWQGFRTALQRYDQDGITFVVLANVNNANVGEILKHVAVLYNPNYKDNSEKNRDDLFPSLTRELIKKIYFIIDQKFFDQVESNVSQNILVSYLEALVKENIAHQLFLINDQPNGIHLDRIYKIHFRTKTLTIYVSFNQTLMNIYSLFIYLE
ncbi:MULTISPECIES: serine hydrolase domain-containing protein [unclassified Acinetobacter]|uniref:serine hydrolase domain-containing protein n=1 Tax=unclassified Acinetobacter TaxID=196816 RepID=UPI00190B29A7|nr:MULTISPECIES: serine hydrolase domain-containing protein [unclassified Acinetobacter]MBK0062106.1 beta-lactamase family protein [Acinetobacter sp. S55]MBK0065910.1 beta-lactamase family protein [Acinetobacter sp. S54]